MAKCINKYLINFQPDEIVSTFLTDNFSFKVSNLFRTALKSLQCVKVILLGKNNLFTTVKSSIHKLSQFPQVTRQSCPTRRFTIIDLIFYNTILYQI